MSSANQSFHPTNKLPSESGAVAAVHEGRFSAMGKKSTDHSNIAIGSLDVNTVNKSISPNLNLTDALKSEPLTPQDLVSPKVASYTLQLNREKMASNVISNHGSPKHDKVMPQAVKLVARGPSTK